MSNELYLSSHPYIDDEHWHKGFDDSLQDRGGPKWTKIQLARADVARCWPFDHKLETKSGAPGRPTSVHLVEREYAARWERGEVLERIGAESEALALWLKTTHPDWPPLTPKTIRNKLGAEHRRRRIAARK